MAQIKTIACPIYESNRFDDNVNRLLNEGWELKKRMVIPVSGEPNEVGSSPVIQALYAELEKNAVSFPEEVTA